MKYKKKFIFVQYLLFIIFTNTIFSQVDNINVIYKVYASEGPLENNEIIKKSKYSYLYEGLDNALLTLEFKLEANKNNSHFYLIDGLSINDKAKRMATNFTGRDDFYIDTKKKTCIREKNILDNYYYVSNTTDINWILVNENKLIQEYLCYKAILEKNVRIKKNSYKTIVVTAWYCPLIPYSFGPKDYFNLPGLILELKEDKITFLATKISLKEKTQNVELSKNKNIISEQEYNKLLDEKTDAFFEKIGKVKND